jgi:hypothetical protein
LRPIDSSGPVKCPAGTSRTGTEIGVIVVGCILAIIMILALVLWIYKWRPLLRRLRETPLVQAPPTVEDNSRAISSLEDGMEELRKRVKELEEGHVRRHELGTTPSRDTGPSAYRPWGSVASVELHSPTERERLSSIPDGVGLQS